MIKYFSVRNFRSIKEECILAFDEGLPKNSKFISNPVIGIAGANASGKTSFLQAITFVLWFMQDSFLKIGDNEVIPFVPFYTTKDIPTNFHIIFSKKTELDGKYRYVDYEYILNVNSENVISEFINYYPYGRKRIVYKREEDKIKFGNTVNIPSLGLNNFKKDLRNNCSIISYASQYDSQFVAKQCHDYSLESNVYYTGMKEIEFNPEIIKDLSQIEYKKEKVIELLKIADIGIKNFQYTKMHQDEFEKTINDIKKMDQNEIKEFPSEIKKMVETIKNEDINNIRFIDTHFVHDIDKKETKFSIGDESSGTIKFLTIIDKVLSSLENGSLLILDEIEIKLHQDLVAYLIGLYQNEFENTDGAQLIFSFHNSIFMNILRPEQLWFAEKNDNGASEIFSASHFEDIKNLHKKNLENLYRIGRFGAKPRGI